MSSKNFAIIPARGGSKRIPNKNTKDFLGKPIISYSIEAAIKSQLFDRIIVSTDDEKVANVARKHGAEVPFFRPRSLADDFCGLDAVVQHAVEWICENDDAEYGYCCMIYATAPMISEFYLRDSFNEIELAEYAGAVTVTETSFPAQRCYQIQKDNRLVRLWEEYTTVRSQDLPPSYQDAAHFNWFNLAKWSYSEKQSIQHQIKPIVLPRWIVQDIDNENDWKMAELLFQVAQEFENQNEKHSNDHFGGFK